MKELIKKYFLWIAILTIPIFYSYTSVLMYNETRAEYKFQKIILNGVIQKCASMSKDGENASASFDEKKEATDNFIKYADTLDKARKNFNKHKIRLIWSLILIFVYISAFAYFNFLKEKKPQ